MNAAQLDNPCPTIYKKQGKRDILPSELDDSVVDKIDSREVFDLLSNICDPERAGKTLDELLVVEERLITVDDDAKQIHISFTPTNPFCEFAVLIGLCLRVKLLRCLPPGFKVTVELTPGSHVSEGEINKQLADKERVAAALDNPRLLSKVNWCFLGTRTEIE